MSRAYRVSVSGQEDRIVHVEDGVEGKVELLPILSPESMGDILAGELEAKGYARTTNDKGETVMVKLGEDNVTVEVNVATGTVHVSIAEDIKVSVEATVTGVADDDYHKDPTAEAKRQAEAGMKAALDKAEAPKREAARKTVTAKLEQELAKVRPELDQAVTGTTAKALVQKAASLGDIESVEGSAEDGNMTIRVRV